MFYNSSYKDKPKISKMFQKFEFGYVNGMFQMFLFNGASNINVQQCVLHSSCGESLHVGEVVLVEQCELECGTRVLRGFRVRQGLKSCCIGSIDCSQNLSCIYELFTNALTQVDLLSEDEAKLSSSVNGCIKLILIGNKDAPQLM